MVGIYNFKTRSRLMEKMETVSRKTTAGQKKLLSGVSKIAIFLARRIGIDNDFESFDRKLFLAGRPFGLTGQEFIGAWIILIGASIIAGTIFALSGTLPPVFAFSLVILLSVLPHLVVTSGAEAGQARLGKEVIDLVMDLELGVSAGLTPIRVLEWYSQNPTMLAVLLKTLIKEASMGKMTHVVFSRLADEYGIVEAREVAVSLKQGEIQGLKISEALSNLSRDLRNSREMDMDIKVVKLKPSIEGVLTLTMMIAAIALMVGPMVAENFGALNQMMGPGF